MIVEDAHLAADGDGGAGERNEGGRDVALPEVHDHVDQADDVDGSEIRLGLGVVQAELV